MTEPTVICPKCSLATTEIYLNLSSEDAIREFQNKGWNGQVLQ